MSASFFSHGFRVNSHADEVPLSIDAVFRLILNILMELMRRRVPSEMEDRKFHRKCITIFFQISFSKNVLFAHTAISRKVAFDSGGLKIL